MISAINFSTPICKFESHNKVLIENSKNLPSTQACFPTIVAVFRLCQHCRGGNCVNDIKNGAFKCKLFVDKCSQMLQKLVVATSMLSYKKLSLFDFVSIWEENYVADLMFGTIRFTLFVDKCCKRLSLTQACFPTKVAFFRLCQHFRRKLCCGHHHVVVTQHVWTYESC